MNHLPVTERISIRELIASDTDTLFQMYSDKEAMKFRGSKPFETREEVEKLLTEINQKIKMGSEFRYGIILKETNQLVGTYLYAPISNTHCKVGLSFCKSFWGLGLGTEVMQIMTSYLKDLGYKTLVGYISPQNFPSLKMIEKLNFERQNHSEYPEYLKYEKSI
ncbi:GNAT family N-acetyltransferase [Flavobacterium sp.]|uniref:GNAT family N-acetyltransferase n=1 Tax=Flavobacterium sp. TaxID=239 RepID=UPI003D0C4B09